jgi:hypothetical protein
MKRIIYIILLIIFSKAAIAQELRRDAYKITEVMALNSLPANTLSVYDAALFSSVFVKTLPLAFPNHLRPLFSWK